MENQNQNFITPSDRLTEFLNVPYVTKIEQTKNYFSYLNDKQIDVLNSKSEQNGKNIYESLLDSKKEDNLISINPPTRPEIDPSFLFNNTNSTSLENNYESINDLKRKEDELQSLTSKNDNSEQSVEVSRGGGSNTNTSVINNTTNVTNIVPDYVLSIKRKSQSPPAWRDTTG